MKRKLTTEEIEAMTGSLILKREPCGELNETRLFVIYTSKKSTMKPCYYSLYEKKEDKEEWLLRKTFRDKYVPTMAERGELWFITFQEQIRDII